MKWRKKMKIQIETVLNIYNMDFIPDKVIEDFGLELGDVVVFEQIEDEQTGQYSLTVLERIRPDEIDNDWLIAIPDSLIREFNLDEGAYVLNHDGHLELVDFETFVDAIPRQVFETIEAIGIDIDELLELLKECRLPYENIPNH